MNNRVKAFCLAFVLFYMALAVWRVQQAKVHSSWVDFSPAAVAARKK